MSLWDASEIFAIICLSPVSVEFLFALYERFTAPLLPVEKKGRRRV
jgi:hypothetical protein